MREVELREGRDDGSQFKVSEDRERQREVVFLFVRRRSVGRKRRSVDGGDS